MSSSTGSKEKVRRSTCPSVSIASTVAVPTSAGYGANFEGLSALLAMLNSCVPGTAVMNIDNGFGAAVHATKINQLVTDAP